MITNAATGNPNVRHWSTSPRSHPTRARPPARSPPSSPAAGSHHNTSACGPSRRQMAPPAPTATSTPSEASDVARSFRAGIAGGASRRLRRPAVPLLANGVHGVLPRRASARPLLHGNGSRFVAAHVEPEGRVLVRQQPGVGHDAQASVVHASARSRKMPRRQRRVHRSTTPVHHAQQPSRSAVERGRSRSRATTRSVLVFRCQQDSPRHPPGVFGQYTGQLLRVAAICPAQSR